MNAPRHAPDMYPAAERAAPRSTPMHPVRKRMPACGRAAGRGPGPPDFVTRSWKDAMRRAAHIALAAMWWMNARLAFGAGTPASRPAGRQSPPQVILAWDGTGRFGPQTPGTRTSGWQEAIDYCVEHALDLYVKGGWGGRKAVYHVQDTIRIPPTQDFRIDGGIYVLNWTGPPDRPDKDLMVIDSTMNGEYHFGILVYGGAGAALRIRPERPVPIDGFPVFIETLIESQGLADPNPFTPGERKAGTGLVLEATAAPITCSRFAFIGGILNFRTCVEASGRFTQNRFECLNLHTNAHNSAMLRLGPECSQNTLRLAIGVDMGATGVTGLSIAGRNNAIEVMTRGGFSAGRDLVLERPARGNRIDLLHFADRFEPLEFVTDEADVPTNQLTWVGGQIAPRTVHVPAGRHVHTQRLYPAAARVAQGLVTRLALVRDGQEIEYPPTSPMDILLGVADQLVVESPSGADIRFVPFKAR